VFTARYGLIPYINRLRFLFKKLIIDIKRKFKKIFAPPTKLLNFAKENKIPPAVLHILPTAVTKNLSRKVQYVPRMLLSFHMTITDACWYCWWYTTTERGGDLLQRCFTHTSYYENRQTDLIVEMEFGRRVGQARTQNRFHIISTFSFKK
jgi:dsRNA-specific ribonuclease